MRFCATLLLMLSLCVASFANDQSKLSPELHNKKITIVEKAMFIGNHKLFGDELETIFSSNDEAASAYSSAQHFYYPGLALTYAGGGLLGYGVGEWIWGDSDLGMYLSIGGAGAIGISETSLRLKLVPTEQGGIAVALAF